MLLNTEVYPLSLLRKAAADYRQLARITIRNTDPQHAECRFENCIYDEELTKKEFLNYLIELENAGKSL